VVRTALHTFFFWAYLIVALPIFFVPALIIFLITFPFDRNGRILHLYTCFWCGQHLWLNPFWRLDVKGKENVDRSKAYVYASNHLSAGDIAVLFTLFLPFKFVSKHQNFWAPFLGWNMYLNRYVRLVRGDSESVKTMMAKCRSWLARGVSIMMFPEGTRSRSGELLPFRAGAFKLAMDSGVPIVPIVLDGTFEALPASGVLRQDRVLTIRVRICEPVDSAAYSDLQAFSDAVRARMLETQFELWKLRDRVPINAPRPLRSAL
jgi:1-acyl-sn-glycerol-3-phosphate acyltransferase